MGFQPNYLSNRLYSTPWMLSPRQSPGSPEVQQRGADLTPALAAYILIEIIFPPHPCLYWIADKISPKIPFVVNISCLFLINAGS